MTTSTTTNPSTNPASSLAELLDMHNATSTPASSSKEETKAVTKEEPTTTLLGYIHILTMVHGVTTRSANSVKVYSNSRKPAIVQFLPLFEMMGENNRPKIEVPMLSLEIKLGEWKKETNMYLSGTLSEGGKSISVGYRTTNQQEDLLIQLARCAVFNHEAKASFQLQLIERDAKPSLSHEDYTDMFNNAI